MAKVTIEVPKDLVGDIYIAVGHVLETAQYELDEAAGQGAQSQGDDDDESADKA